MKSIEHGIFQGLHYIMPLHADFQVRIRKAALDCLTPILWFKIANGSTEAQGNGAGFYGKPYQPGAIIKNDVEYILFFRKGGEYRSPTPIQKTLSMLTKNEMKTWLRSAWHDIKGESTRKGHPAPYPAESISCEIEDAYLKIAFERLKKEIKKPRITGANNPQLEGIL